MAKPYRMVPLLNVEDVARSIQFYSDVAGFEVGQRYESDGTVVWAEIRCGNIVLMLNTPDGVDSSARRRQQSYRETVFYFGVDNARALHDDLQARGFAVGPVERQFYGSDEFLLRDPDGYELAFGSPAPKEG